MTGTPREAVVAVVVTLTVGEPGNPGYISRVFARVVCPMTEFGPVANGVHSPARIGQKQVRQPEKPETKPARYEYRRTDLGNKYCWHHHWHIQRAQQPIVLQIRADGKPCGRIAPPDPLPVMVQNHGLLTKPAQREQDASERMMTVDDPSGVAVPEAIFRRVRVVIGIRSGMMETMESHPKQW